MSAGELLGWIGVALCVARLVPQPWHTARRGVDAGVSGLSLCNNLVSDLGWIAYGLYADLTPVWVTGLLVVPVDLVTIWLVRGRVDARAIKVSALWGVAIVGSFVLGGPMALGIALGLSVVVNHGPQVALAVRATDISGLHPATWVLALVEAGLWGGYGVLDRDLALVFYGVVLGAAGAVVLTSMVRSRVPMLDPAL